MKFLKSILAVIGGAALFSSCNDEFLDKFPQDKFTNETFWKSDGDFRAYALGLYSFPSFQENGYANCDDVVLQKMDQDARIYDRRVVPQTGGGWSWSYLRKINIMVAHARNCKTLPEADKNHWLGIARLFRAREYHSKVLSFGDVPWIGRELGTESEELYKPKDSRALVMDSVLADLNFAVKHIREKDGNNQVNRDVALAIKSQICLYEASYRKYHTELKLNDAEKWYRESIDASEKLMGGKYSLTPNFRELYSSLDLSKNPECIFFYQYDDATLRNNITFRMSLADGCFGATKDAIEAYLCKDGLPYGISPLHPKAQKGEPEYIDEEFQNRDPRMLMTFVIPYENNAPVQLPAIDEAYSGKVPPFMPSFPGEDYISSPTGYHPYKWWNSNSINTDVNLGSTDFPIYTLNQILLNYAEAKAELGECTDDVLNKSINLLRDRVDMPHLTVAKAEQINDQRHQKYAPEISNLLWEIRRERRVELMMDGNRLRDILRWKKASWLSKPFLGCYIDLENRPKEAYNAQGVVKANIVLGDRECNIIPGATKGYVLPYRDDKQPVWSDDDLKVYYDPINKQDLVLNPNLTQSPGWENE